MNYHLGNLYSYATTTAITDIPDGRGSFLLKHTSPRSVSYTIGANKTYHNLEGPAIIWNDSNIEEYWVNGDLCYVANGYDPSMRRYYTCVVIEFLLNVNLDIASVLVDQLNLAL